MTNKDEETNNPALDLMLIRREVEDAIKKHMKADIWNVGTLLDQPPVCDIQFKYKGIDYSIDLVKIDPKDMVELKPDNSGSTVTTIIEEHKAIKKAKEAEYESLRKENDPTEGENNA